MSSKRKMGTCRLHKAKEPIGHVFTYIGNTANTGFTDEEAVGTWINTGPMLSNQNARFSVTIITRHLLLCRQEMELQGSR